LPATAIMLAMHVVNAMLVLALFEEAELPGI